MGARIFLAFHWQPSRFQLITSNETPLLLDAPSRQQLRETHHQPAIEIETLSPDVPT